MQNKLNKKIVCADGFEMSVQANALAHCEPCVNNSTAYTSVEVGFPNRNEILLTQYAEMFGEETTGVYRYVPAQVIINVCVKHGGIVSGELPNGIAYIPAS